MRPGRNTQRIRIPRTFFTLKKGGRKTFLYSIKHISRGDALLIQEKQKNKAEAMQKEMHKCKTIQMNKMNSSSCCKENGKCPA